LRLRGYRPHIVIEGVHLGVEFCQQDITIEPGETARVKIALLHFPSVTYERAVPGATFSVMEGGVVAAGTILERVGPLVDARPPKGMNKISFAGISCMAAIVLFWLVGPVGPCGPASPGVLREILFPLAYFVGFISWLTACIGLFEVLRTAERRLLLGPVIATLSILALGIANEFGAWPEEGLSVVAPYALAVVVQFVPPLVAALLVAWQFLRTCLRRRQA